MVMRRIALPVGHGELYSAGTASDKSPHGELSSECLPDSGVGAANDHYVHADCILRPPGKPSEDRHKVLAFFSWTLPSPKLRRQQDSLNDELILP